MLDVVTTSFYIKSPEFRKEEFELYSTELFDEWERYVESVLNLPDYSLTLVIEEGSIKGTGKVAAAVAALYFGIGSYGDFIGGVQNIRAQAEYISNALFDQAKRNFGCTSARGNSKRTGGEVFYLDRLFERVQRGVITPDQAMDEVRQRWSDEGASAKLINELSRNLEDAPRYPEQMTLSDETWEECTEFEVAPEKEPLPRIPRSPEPSITQHYRIEIYRPSKGDKKKIRVTKIK